MRPTGIKLPQTLLEQIQGDSFGRGGHGHARKPKLSRKEARKQDRAEKKQRKALHFTSNAYTDPPPGAKRPADSNHEHPDSPVRKKARRSEDETRRPSDVQPATNPKGTVANAKASADVTAKKRQQSALQKLADRTASMPMPRTQAERDEDAYIARLEAQLGMGKRSKKGGGDFEDDGLDELLDGLDSIVGPGPGAVDSASEVSDEDEDAEEKSVSTTGDDLTDAEVAPEWTGFASDAEEDSAPGGESPVSSAPPPSAASTSGRYVPPHLRNKTASADETEALAKLTRQLKGLLNRLSEQNIASILDEIEELYRKHRRHDMTETLTNLLVNGITSHSSMLDSFVILNAALMSALHKIIGVKFAAFIVQNVVAKYEEHYSALSAEDTIDASDEAKGKECSNLIILLSELYNFQVISSVLIYDIIRTLLDGDLSETDVELLLKLLRNSGHQLRLDDPTALKDIIQIVQTKVGANESSSSSRTRFMVETLINLKNNKTKQRTAAQHTGGDSVERLKKFLTGLGKKRHLMAHDPLRVSLADLRSADSRGKWWLVGAAWGGNPLVEHQAQQQKPQPENASAAVAENVLLKLAKKQGMNTDIRRSIFVVLMSSDDYMDACERLGQLNLTEVQQREIIRVILHCCGNEKSYNPYYTLVGQHLANSSHSHKITLQFCLWDFLRDLGETSVGGAELIKSLGEDSFGGSNDKISPTRRRNIARAYAWWIARDAVSLTVLKPVDFIALKPATRRFVRDLLERIFFDTQARSPALAARVHELPSKRDRTAIETAFLKAARVPALAAGLAYFLAEMDKARDVDNEEDVFYKWAGGVAVETLRMGTDIVSSL
ncbi:hypothetical protein PENSPDRAFT_649267 [Peniophora sp. CONT]|nr:hypothetical protein PENSPDRAFT_649267 [Peniophora sp. CONT]